jgi:hypothetical protein
MSFFRNYAAIGLSAVISLAMTSCSDSAPPADQSAPPPIVEPAAEHATYWPIGLNTPDGELVMYQPQPTALQGNQLSARAAVSWTPTGGQALYGTADFKARVMTDRDSQMVSLEDINSIQVHLPGATPQQEQQFATVAQHEMPGMGITFPLDQLLASLDTAQPAVQAAAQQGPAAAPAEAFNNDPPKINFSSTPATLISVNGPPKMLPVDDHPGVQEVVNTPFIMLYDPAGRRYYLKAGTRWVSATDIAGAWTNTTDVPADIQAAGDFLATPPPGEATTEPGVAGAGQSPASRPAELTEAAADTQIIVSTNPAELIVTQGPAQFTPIPGGQLLYCSNTQSDLFLYQPTQHYYLLLAGRWYVAPALLGPWQYLPAAALPADFQNIPADSPKANVRASVPGTGEAREAVLNAEIPQTASVRRDAGKDVNVAYDGDPKFQQVGNGPVSYAVNTPSAVLQVNGVYYCCDEAVWYQAPGPMGPWTVCVSVPQAIYSIPPNCPLYYVTYCSVYDSTPDYVYCGYLPGYAGSYVEGPTVIYGTGYDYGGWYGSAYFAYPCTWGFAAVYDPWTYDWGFGLGYYWNTGWFSHQWHNGWWRHHWRQVGRHDGSLNRWWGPHGYVNYNRMRTHDAALRAGGHRGDEFGGVGRRNIYQRPRNIARNITPDNRRFAGNFMSNRANDLFAGRDGQVYRRSDAGWESRSPSDWTRLHDVPGAERGYEPRAFPQRAYAPPEAGMERDYMARSRGDFRANTVHNFGEFRGGGEGGFRGGGGGGFHGGGGGGFHGGGGGRR